MKIPPSIFACSLLAIPLFAQESRPDLIRLVDGGLLHGHFAGLQQEILWESPQIKQPVQFDPKSINQIIFSEGHPEKPSPPSSTAHLINDDEILGKILSLNETHLIYESAIAGELKIARNQLARLQPNPHGGTLHYAGPFSSDNWILPISQPEENQEKGEEEAEAEAEGKKQTKLEPKASTPPWIFSSAAFYSKSSTPLIRILDLPEQGRLRFKMAWRNRLNFSLAFHCDLKRPIIPENDQEEKDASEKDEQAPPSLKFENLTELRKGNHIQTVPWLKPNNSNHALTFGTGYVLSFFSSYPSLHRCYFSETGQTKVTNLRSSRGRPNLGENGEAEFDLRFDKAQNSIVLFVNGDYVSQWNDMNGYIGQGQAIGFVANSQCELRLSDIRVSAWNGVRDSARSMEHAERDIVLLTNGTDRFSGKITAISKDRLSLKSLYATLDFPLSEIADIHFASNHLTQPDTVTWPPETSLLYTSPTGRLTLVPEHASADTIHASSPLLGNNLSIQLESATLLELNKAPHDLDEWFDEF